MRKSYVMMKILNRIIGIMLAALLLLPVSGCDAFRKLAGRPTAEEIELMRIEKLKQEEAVRRHRIDSLVAVQREKEDSIAIMDSLAQIKGTVLNPSEIGGLFTTKLDFKYYIVVGSFKSRHNAESLLSTVAEKGYKPILISFRNGFNAIAVAPTNSLREAFSSLKNVRPEAFCPDDVWILVNE